MSSLFRNLLVAAALLFAGPALAYHVYYVDDLRGSDANGDVADPSQRCTSRALPCKTVQKAATLVRAIDANNNAGGDTILVNQGTYRFDINPPGFTTTTISLPTGTKLIGEGWVVFKVATAVAVVIDNKSNITIRNITFDLNAVWAIYRQGSTFGTNILIEDCRFYGGYGMYLEGVEATVRGSLFWSNTQGIQYGNYSGKLTVIGNTFHASGYGVYLTNGSTAGDVALNNVFTNVSYGIHNVGGTHTWLQRDGNVFNPGNMSGNQNTAYPLPGAVNIFGVDPKYVDPLTDPRNFFGYHGYAVAADSPIIGKGAAISNELQTPGCCGIGKVFTQELASHDWAGFYDDGGAPVFNSAKVAIDTNGNIVLKSGVTVATIRSPVVDTGANDSVLMGIDVLATEFTAGLLPGNFQLIDNDINTSPVPSTTPEIEVRVGTAIYNPLDDSGAAPAWKKKLRSNNFREPGRYYQFRLTLRKNGI